MKYSVLHMSFLKSVLMRPQGDVFGKQKLLIIDWLHVLAKTKDASIYQCMTDLRIPSLLLALMGEHSTHSILHLQVYRTLDLFLGLSDNQAIVESVARCCDSDCG